MSVRVELEEHIKQLVSWRRRLRAAFLETHLGGAHNPRTWRAAQLAHAEHIVTLADGSAWACRMHGAGVRFDALDSPLVVDMPRFDYPEQVNPGELARYVGSTEPRAAATPTSGPYGVRALPLWEAMVVGMGALVDAGVLAPVAESPGWWVLVDAHCAAPQREDEEHA